MKTLVLFLVLFFSCSVAMATTYTIINQEEFDAITWTDIVEGDTVIINDDLHLIETGYMQINNSGTSSNPITIQRSGTGTNKPIIDYRYDVPDNWSEDSTNIWELSETGYIYRLWQNDVEYPRAASIDGINSEYRYYHDGQTLTLYSTSEPTGVYCTKYLYGFELYESDYVHIDGIEVRYPVYGCRLWGASNNTIENCTFYRTGTAGIDLMGDGSVSSDDNTISGNIVNVDYTAVANDDSIDSYGTEGIRFRQSASNNIVSGNTVTNISHSCISLEVTVADTADCLGINYNNVYGNDLSSPDSTYGRGVGIGGPDGYCTYNTINANYIHDTSVRSQIGGSYNTFSNNIIDTVFRSTRKAAVSEAILLGGWVYNGLDHVNHNNTIAYNTIVGTADEGIIFENSGTVQVYDNDVVNNIIKDTTSYGINVQNSEYIHSNSFENNAITALTLSDVIRCESTDSTVDEANSAYSYFSENIDSSSINSSYTQSLDSLTIDHGKYISGVSYDYNGNNRTYGVSSDIGATEIDYGTVKIGSGTLTIGSGEISVNG